MLLLKNNLLIAIVNHGHGERFFSIAKREGVGGGTIIPAKGTASSSILRMLGLGDTSKELVLIVLDDALADRIIEAVREDGRTQGVAALFGNTREKDNMECKWKMISIIVNTGYSDDIMEAARKAGATGGTITHARGTASPDDARFLGMTIVPEKEMIMILCQAEKADRIVSAVTSLKCLDEPGVGIIYTQDVSDFRNLDPKK